MRDIGVDSGRSRGRPVAAVQLEIFPMTEVGEVRKMADGPFTSSANRGEAIGAPEGGSDVFFDRRQLSGWSRCASGFEL